jgi:hypothetical protein
VRVFKTNWFVRFARKERIADRSLLEAVEQAERGLIDADLGNGVIKQRVGRPGQGKSGGYRTIIIYRSARRAIFVFGFTKSRMANIEPDELDGYRKLASIYLAKSEKDMDGYVAEGALSEVKDNEEES